MTATGLQQKCLFFKYRKKLAPTVSCGKKAAGLHLGLAHDPQWRTIWLSHRRHEIRAFVFVTVTVAVKIPHKPTNIGIR